MIVELTTEEKAQKYDELVESGVGKHISAEVTPLKQKVSALTAALEFYANLDHWDGKISECMADAGQKARDVLKLLK